MHPILDSALLECLDVCHLHDQTQCGFLREQGGVNDLDFVIGVCITGLEHDRVFAAYQLYLDIDADEQESSRLRDSA